MQTKYRVQVNRVLKVSQKLAEKDGEQKQNINQHSEVGAIARSMGPHLLGF